MVRRASDGVTAVPEGSIGHHNHVIAVLEFDALGGKSSMAPAPGNEASVAASWRSAD